MTVVNPKSISGINSITTGSGSDNLLTIHTSDASSTERVRINSSGDVIVGSGITVSPDGDIFATGVCTATSFSGSGANLTGIDTDLVSDTSPQLGGNLETNDKNIVFGDSSGATVNRLALGAGTDFSIYHNGTNTILDNNTGNLQIDTTANEVHNVQSEFQVKVKGGDEDGLKVITDGAVELYHNNTKKAETISSGLEVFGSLIAENDGAGSGTSEIQLQPYGTDGYINCTASGNLYTRMGSGYAIRTQIDGSGNFIVQSGNVKLATSGKGIDFSSTSDAGGMSSEVLDDYEEGTFSPIPDAGGGVSFTYAYNNGWYTKIGNTVTFQIYLMFYASSISSGNAGNGVAIQGLPFTIKNNDRYNPAFTIGRTYNFDIDSDQRIYAYGDYNSTNIRMIIQTDDSTGSILTAGQVDQSTCLTFISGTYQV